MSLNLLHGRHTAQSVRCCRGTLLPRLRHCRLRQTAGPAQKRPLNTSSTHRHAVSRASRVASRRWSSTARARQMQDTDAGGQAAGSQAGGEAATCEWRAGCVSRGGCVQIACGLCTLQPADAIQMPGLYLMGTKEAPDHPTPVPTAIHPQPQSSDVRPA